jgi:hypothetical protein
MSRSMPQPGTQALADWKTDPPAVDNPRLFIKRCSDHGSIVWELMERDYPNKLLCASADIESIRAVARLHAMFEPEYRVPRPRLGVNA